MGCCEVGKYFIAVRERRLQKGEREIVIKQHDYEETTYLEQESYNSDKLGEEKYKEEIKSYNGTCAQIQKLQLCYSSTGSIQK